MTRIGTHARLLIAAAIVLSWVAPPVMAERIGVRSGEHDGFSRLVFDLPKSATWTLTQDGPRARLTLSGLEANFDLSDVFRRLSAGRITALTRGAEKNTLEISLSCDCTTETFRLGEQMLVVDIRGAPDSLASTDAPIRPRTATAPKPAADTGKPKPSQKPTGTHRHFFAFETTEPRPLVGLTFGSLTNSPPDTASRAPVTHPLTKDQLARTERVSEAEKRLAQELSRAAVQGLVKPRAATLPKMAMPGEAATKSAKPEPPPVAISPPDTPGVNLRAQTSADRDFLQLFGAVAQNRDGARCFSDRELDVANWASDAPFGAQVGALRARLVGEFDRPDPRAARDLIKLYIYFGFGAEALHVMKTTAPSGRGLMLLKSLAEINEFGHALSPGALSRQFDCDTHAAFWAVLAHDTLPAGAQPNANAILRTVSGLPPHIRSYLGPIAIERLTRGGHPEAAQQVLRLVERGHSEPDTPFHMADAGINLATGNMEAATEALTSVVDANTELSPKALIELIDSRLEADKPVDIQTADLAGAYALEYRKHPLGPELKRVHILALAEAGAFDQAFRELALFVAHATAEDTRRVRSHAMAALAQDADDISFLKYALAIDDPTALELDPGSGNRVGKRLVALGFPQQADAYLRPGVEGVDGRERRLIRASAALAQNKPRRAEADLLGLTGNEADLLRAEARAMNGDHASAHRLFSQLDQKPEQETEAWLASDWSALRETGDPLWQETANMTTSELPTDPAGILAHNRALIDNSASARDTMQGLLARMSVDDWPDRGE